MIFNRFALENDSGGEESAKDRVVALLDRTISSVEASNISFVGDFAFAYLSALTTASFPACTTIETWAFSKCTNLISLYLTGSSVVSLAASTVFSSTPIGGYSAEAETFGSVYVPSSLLTSYKAATNWSIISSRFVGI